VRDRGGAVLDEIERAIVGKREALELILAAVLCDGHVLLEDYPGLAKTLTARSFAQATTLRFSRIQFTPDLMPSDVTGSSVFDQSRAEFTFLPGPIFTNLLLADEINRAPPQTQAALLEARTAREPAWEPRSAQAVAREGGSRRTRLRGPGGREGRGGAGSGPPAHAATRALGAADSRRGHRRRGTRDGADPAGRGFAARSWMTRLDSPRL